MRGDSANGNPTIAARFHLPVPMYLALSCSVEMLAPPGLLIVNEYQKK